MRFARLAFARFARLRRHCSHAELVAFQCASLEASAARRTARHLAACTRCSSELDLIREDFALLDRTLAVDHPLTQVAAEDWARLLAALDTAPSASRRHPSPEVLAAYLGHYARSAAGAGPAPMEVLETLLGARAAAAISAAVLDTPGEPEASS